MSKDFLEDNRYYWTRDRSQCKLVVYTDSTTTIAAFKDINGVVITEYFGKGYHSLDSSGAPDVTEPLFKSDDEWRDKEDGHIYALRELADRGMWRGAIIGDGPALFFLSEQQLFENCALHCARHTAQVRSQGPLEIVQNIKVEIAQLERLLTKKETQ